MPQLSLALDSGATIFSNQESLQSIKKSNRAMRIHCGGSTFDQEMMGRLREELNHLPLPKGEVCIAKDAIANLLSMGKLVKEGYRVYRWTLMSRTLSMCSMKMVHASNLCV